jgi:short-subunit dehydrogenase
VTGRAFGSDKSGQVTGMQLSGSHVLVTGASRGIGACLAREAARRGATVTLVARSTAPLTSLAAELGGHALPTDLADPEQVRGLVRRAEEQAGRPVDVLANDAGIEAAGSLLDLTADDLAYAVALNLLAPAELTRQVLPGMVARGRGHVLNVSSGYSTVNTPGLITYCATKAGLSHFTSGVAQELRGTGVETTLVEPGPVRTAMWERLQPTLPSASLQRLLRLRLARVVEPGDVARAALDKVEAGGGHVVLPRRMVPVVAFTWIPRRTAELVLTGVRRR